MAYQIELQRAKQALADSEGLPAYLIENIKREIERLEQIIAVTINK